MEDVIISVLSNGLWIVGLAVVLTAISYHSHEAQRNGRRLRQQAGERSFVLAVWAGLALIALGLAATSGRLWETIVWIAFALYALSSILRNWRPPSVMSVEGSSPRD